MRQNRNHKERGGKDKSSRDRGGRERGGGSKPEHPPTLYGFHAVAEAWLNEERQVQALYITEQAQASFDPILKQGKAKGIVRDPAIIVEKKKLEKMLPQGAVHQGIALAASGVAEFSVEDLIIKTQSQERAVILMLDQVTDPHNVGAIIRSACAFGAAGVVMQKKHAPALNGVLAKTACGAVEHVPVAFVTNLSRALEEFKEGGYFSYGLDERGEMDIGELGKKPGKCVLIMGAEGPGIRHLVKEHCDSLVRLPMHGPMPSINVSNAAAVALYAVTETA
jgi:23S rRNA (guanosine2251-2'-O)-methyltransferase